MESKRKFAKIGNKYYTIVGLYSGFIYLSNANNVNNDISKSGIIWEIDGLVLHDNLNLFVILYYRVIRFFKTNIFGISDFLELIK